MRRRNPWLRLLRNIKNGAKETKFSATTYVRGRKHEIPVEITWEDLKEQFEQQGGRCYWLELELNPDDIFISNYPLAISADRLDGSKGYIKGNVVITCRLINLGRGRWPAEQFKQVIALILPLIEGTTNYASLAETKLKLVS
jgi:hypothetical protein